MSEEDQDKSSKTEEPSQKRLDEALEKGQVVHSKELTSFIMFFLLTLVAIWVFPYLMVSIAQKLRFLIQNAGKTPVDQGSISVLLKDLMMKGLLYTSPIFIVTIVSAIGSSYIQHGGFILTFEQIQPKLSKISIIKGFQKLFSVKNLVEFLKGIIKITVVGFLVYLVILADIREMTQYQELSAPAILSQLNILIFDILVLVTVIMALIAGVDFVYQKYEHYSQLKMTKQEVKEEYKQTEGDPEIKQRIRALRREQSQRRIKQAVPNATVVITNPEHYAVALKYDMNSTGAPICVAKGGDLMAQKIKEIAKEHEVTIVENPPLARALYKDVKIDEEIPLEHFEAVAKIISYVMAIEKQSKKKKIR